MPRVRILSRQIAHSSSFSSTGFSISFSFSRLGATVFCFFSRVCLVRNFILLRQSTKFLGSPKTRQQVIFDLKFQELNIFTKKNSVGLSHFFVQDPNAANSSKKKSYKTSKKQKGGSFVKRKKKKTERSQRKEQERKRTRTKRKRKKKLYCADEQFTVSHFLVLFLKEIPRFINLILNFFFFLLIFEE